MLQNYRIAGLNVRMDSFGRTEAQAVPYLSQFDEPDIVVSSAWQVLKQRHPHLSDEDCEYLSTGSSFYRQLLSYDGLLLHASAVVVDGRAYLFSAPSGTGKSTHTRLWQQVFGSDRVQILNDDKPALRRENGIWYAYGTPWSGKHDISINARIPLGGICFLEQSAENSIAPYGGAKLIFSLLEQTMRPADACLRSKLMELLDLLITEIPVWKMGCNTNPEAAMISYRVMTEQQKE